MEQIKDHDNLNISRKNVSIMVAFLIILITFVFIAGFFWGYRQATGYVQVNLKKNSFSDQINYTVSVDNNQAPEIIDSEIINPEVIASSVPNVIMPLEDKSENKNYTTAELDNSKYYAKLIGFGHHKSAHDFLDRLKAKGYSVMIKKRISKNSNGKNINWYQIVTDSFSSREELEKLVDIIKKTEKLQGVKIVKIN